MDMPGPEVVMRVMFQAQREVRPALCSRPVASPPGTFLLLRLFKVNLLDDPAGLHNQPGDLLQVGIHNGRPLARRLPMPAQVLQKLLPIGSIFK